MTMLAVAFACVWMFVTLYISWLGFQQHQLADRLNRLAPFADDSAEDKHSAAKAA